MRRYSGFRLMQFIIGILLVILGIWTLSHPGAALTGLVLLYGLLAVLTGGRGLYCAECGDGLCHPPGSRGGAASDPESGYGDWEGSENPQKSSDPPGNQLRGAA